MHRRVRVKFGPAAGQTGWVVDSAAAEATHYGVLMDKSGAVTWGGFFRYRLETTHTAAADAAEWFERQERERAAKAQRVPDVSGRAGFARAHRGRR